MCVGLVQGCASQHMQHGMHGRPRQASTEEHTAPRHSTVHPTRTCTAPGLPPALPPAACSLPSMHSTAYHSTAQHGMRSTPASLKAFTRPAASWPVIASTTSSVSVGLTAAFVCGQEESKHRRQPVCVWRRKRTWQPSRQASREAEGERHVGAAKRSAR